MLSLTRRKGEAVQIGPDITVTFVDAGDGRVRLLLDLPSDTALKLEPRIDLSVTAKRSGRAQFNLSAPPEVSIYRNELVGGGGDVPA